MSRIFKGLMLFGISTCFFCMMVPTSTGQAPADALPNGAAGDSWQTVAVDNTFNNAPFRYQIKFHAQRNGYRVYHLKYPSPVKTALRQNNTVPAEYYLPGDMEFKGDSPIFADHRYATVPGKSGQSPSSPRPAVICLHILDGNDVLTDMVCSSLALKGVPAIMFKLPYYGERGLPGGPAILANDPKLFTDAIAQAGQDLRRTIDVLASRPEVDREKIGVTGISLGGIIAATAAGGEPRINRAVFVLSGGDLLTIIHHARETRPLSEMIKKLSPAERGELEAKIAEVDPLRFAQGLREKARQGKILMIGAAEDEVIPRACTEKLAAAMEMNGDCPDFRVNENGTVPFSPRDNRVVWIKGLGHYTSMAELPGTLQMTADFFAQDLPPGTKPPVVEKQSGANQALAGVMRQIAEIIDTKPEPGRCHIVDLEVTAKPTDQQPQQGRFRLVLGAQGKFTFYCKLPTGTEISIGQNDHPWMKTGAKEVYEGIENPAAASKDLQEILGPKRVALLRMLSGLLKAIAMTPDVLDRLIATKDGGTQNGLHVIQMSGRENIPLAARLALKPESNTPQRLMLNTPNMETTIKFTDWQINSIAPDALFEPPADLPRRKVEQSFLYTLFSTSLRFVFEVQ
jgi:dienelactone hydrolase